MGGGPWSPELLGERHKLGGGPQTPLHTMTPLGTWPDLVTQPHYEVLVTCGSNIDKTHGLTLTE